MKRQRTAFYKRRYAQIIEDNLDDETARISKRRPTLPELPPHIDKEGLYKHDAHYREQVVTTEMALARRAHGDELTPEEHRLVELNDYRLRELDRIIKLNCPENEIDSEDDAEKSTTYFKKYYEAWRDGDVAFFQRRDSEKCEITDEEEASK